MYISQDKIEAYTELVNKVNCFDKNELEKMQLTVCENCTEINLWSYWEGGISHLNAEIVLVGQDWGAIDYSDEPITEIISNHPEKLQSFCYMKNNENMTNKHICILLDSLYKDVGFENDCNTQTQLFFTNFVPWYRKPGAKISGGYDKSWEIPSVNIFYELIDIIRPKIIMCLGEKTFSNVCKALNVLSMPKGKNYSEIIEGGFCETKLGADTIKVFPLMHPGYWGTRTRPLEMQKKDWEKVRESLG